MKVAVVLLAVLALGFSAPQPRKLFHEHFDDFMNIIFEEAGDDLDHLFEHYIEFEEFRASLDYVQTTNFKELVYEMESLPEFKAVVEFLENDNIDILFFIDMFNELVEQAVPRTRHTISGTNLSAFITDAIAEFPKAKLQALFDQKMAEEEEFRTAIDNLQSEEWDNVWSALWENETFQKEVQTLADNGIEMHMLLDEIMAVFGQN
ncbi:protein G12-like [Epargyreus clarus]|uniref:protein G12-like n=1 Tax=Epargyreus clarus TaxID=520877 RepID=UPI003C2EC0E9